MPTNPNTSYLFAYSCFKEAKTRLNQAVGSPRERLIAALESLTRIVLMDLPREARPHFLSICNAVGQNLEANAPRLDSKSLLHAIKNMHDAKVEEIEQATLMIARYVDERRRVTEENSVRSNVPSGRTCSERRKKKHGLAWNGG